MADKYTRTMTVYIENVRNDHREYVDNGIVRRFFGWAIVEDSGIIDGKFCVRRKPLIFETREDMERAIETYRPDKTPEYHYFERYDHMHVAFDYRGQNKPDKSKVILIGIENVKPNKNIFNPLGYHPSGYKSTKIETPLYADGVDYGKFFEKIIKLSREVPLAQELSSDLYSESDRSERISSNIEARREESRIRKDNFLNSVDSVKKVPGNVKNVISSNINYVRDRIRVKNIIIYLTAIMAVFGVVKALESIILSNGNNARFVKGIDCIVLDNPLNNTDRKLRDKKDEIEPVCSNMIRNNYSGLTEQSANDVFSYLHNMELSNHDGNASLNRFVFEGFEYYIKCNPSQFDDLKNLLRDHDNKYQSSFQKTAPRNLVEDKAKSFLDWALPMVLMNGSAHEKGLYSQRYDSSSKAHATNEEIEAYRLLPDVMRIKIIEEIKGIMFKLPNYDFKYPHFFGNVLKKLDEIEAACKSQIVFAIAKQSSSLINQAEQDGLVGYIHGGK